MRIWIIFMVLILKHPINYVLEGQVKYRTFNIRSFRISAVKKLKLTQHLLCNFLVIEGKRLITLSGAFLHSIYSVTFCLLKKEDWSPWVGLSFPFRNKYSTGLRWLSIYPSIAVNFFSLYSVYLTSFLFLS